MYKFQLFLAASVFLLPLSLQAQNAPSGSPAPVSAVSAATKGTKESRPETPQALKLKANLKDGQTVQAKIALTLRTDKDETLELSSFKRTELYMSLLNQDPAALGEILTGNAWTSSDTDTHQQLAYPGFQLVRSPDGDSNTIVANAGGGKCQLPLTVTGLHTDHDKASVSLRLLPNPNPSPACAASFPHLQAIDAVISAEAYEYKMSGNANASPVLFFLHNGMFNISSNPLLMPRDINDVGIYRYTLSVQGKRTEGKPDPGVKLESKDIISNAIVFSGFALWGNHSFNQAVSQMSTPWLFGWLSDMADTSPYFSDGIIYKNLKGQQIQFVYRPAEDGKSFRVSEMTFRPNGELEELCHYPLEYTNADFVQGQADQVSRIVVNFNVKKDPTGNDGSCSGIPIASYPSKMTIALLPEVTVSAQVNDILGLH